ncbi:DUF3558 domain-containing protein [Streptoalloteichus tenebrarius]|uniref:DUF3558 domain-containing protein n=1 Tax=Streptoalloteichus tenebrarius (strain ATCC 17920 / DSM 40477 / JCM 4838 / CBS 697.72 / NBRC 16177 / NCIMB 11028 / NRRL B-12390 / A12253. 1 / ISP 5477) TaxID=1933 RepID=UPI0020A4621D|nr:DUF3558 domain-containing protein [Streptoalloteichus tenebrarius]
MAAGLGLAACTSTTPGLASTSTDSQSSTPNNEGAPKVTNPKNLKAIADPCQLLTPQQLQELGASGQRSEKSKWGEAACTWRNDNLSIHLAPDTTQGKGLSTVYANRNASSQEITVGGHPGMRTTKESLTCSIYVGVSDTQVFLTNVIVFKDVKPEYKDRCAFAEKVAGMVLTNLPPAN